MQWLELTKGYAICEEGLEVQKNAHAVTAHLTAILVAALPTIGSFVACTNNGL